MKNSTVINKKYFIVHESVLRDAFSRESKLHSSARKFVNLAGDKASDYSSFVTITCETLREIKKSIDDNESILPLLSAFKVDDTTIDMEEELNSIKSIKYLAQIKPPKYFVIIVVNDENASSKFNDLAFEGITIVNTAQVNSILTDWHAGKID